jgi:hypothetical protein
VAFTSVHPSRRVCTPEQQQLVEARGGRRAEGSLGAEQRHRGERREGHGGVAAEALTVDGAMAMEAGVGATTGGAWVGDMRSLGW